MREILSDIIKNEVKRLFLKANVSLGENERALISRARESENSETAKSVMSTIFSNLDIAERESIPICQDTGMAIVFAEIGQEVCITGGALLDSVNKGVAEAYTEGYFRASVVSDPLFDRKNTGNNTPAIIYTDIVPGDKIKITAVPKGFGSENKSAIKMFTPTSSAEDIITFVAETAKNAGASACPPLFIGVGIGGTFDYAAVLSKKALARGAGTKNPDEKYARLEEEILGRINSLGIGPQGFGGKNTALGVNIEKYPTHIAGLPVAVNICCHVIRHETAVI